MLGLTASANSYYPLDGLIYFINKYSIDFDGVDDCIVTDGADTVLQNTTYSFWCKSSTTGSNRGIFGHGGNKKGAFHFMYDGTRPLLFLGDTNFVYWNGTTAQYDGEWHHWVVYSDPNDITNSKLYVDGVLQTVSSITSSGSLNAYTESLTIGGDQAVGGNYFEGQIDEFAVFDRELTQDEITRMYNTYYSPNRVANGNFSQIGNEEVTNGDFSQIGSEEVTNGSFATDSDWTKGTGWTIANGIASYDGSSGTQSIGQTGVVDAGKTYKLTLDVVSNEGSGANTIYLGGIVVSTIHLEADSYTFFVTTSSTASLSIFGRSGENFSIDNVSVKEVGQDWIFGTGWSIGDNKALNTGGANFSDLTQLNTDIIIGKNYKITYTVSDYVSGSFKFIMNSNTTSGLLRNADGTYTDYLTSSAQGYSFRTQGSGFIGSVTDISVKEVGQHWTFGTGWSTDGTKAIAGSGSDGNFLYSAQSLIVGKTYKVSFSAIVSSGTVRVYSGGFPGLEVSSTSSFSGSFVAAATQFGFYSSGFDGSIDNIVVQELKHDATNLMLNAGAYQSANPLITSTKSMDFDGTDDYLQLSEAFNYTNHTICGWAYSGVTNANNIIFSASDSASDGIRLMFRSSSNFRYRINGSNIDTATNTRQANRWYFVCGTYDGTTARIYIDGVELANATTSQTISTPDTSARIGSNSYEESNFFDGNITEVGAFNRALTSLEVASLYNQGMPTNLLVNRNNYQSGNPTVFNTKLVDFDGVDDYLDTNKSDFLGTSDFTISGWIKPEDITENYLLGQSEDTNNRWYVRITSSSVLQFYSKSGGVEQVSVPSSTTIANNEWVHFVITADRGANTIVYVNGIANNTSTNVNTSTLSNTGTFRIGSYQFASQYWNGQISQVGIWNEVLTADEVSSLYNHGLPIDLTTNQAAYESSSNLVGYWRMGGGTLDTYPLIADQTNATLGSELVTNGDFATNSDWSFSNVSFSAGAITFNSVSGSAFQNLSFTEGKVYQIAITSTGVGTLRYRTGFTGTDGTTVNFPTSNVVYFTATSNSNRIQIRGDLSDTTMVLHSVSVKQVNGNPAMMINLGGGANFSDGIKNGSPYANIVQNSDFATDGIPSTNTWTLGWYSNTANVSISGGKITLTNSASESDSRAYATDGVSSNNILTTNKFYKLQYEVIENNGVTSFKYYSSAGSFIDAPSSIGIHTVTIQNTANQLFLFQNATTNSSISLDNLTISEVNTGLQGYWKMGDGTNDEYPVIYDQTNPTNGVELSSDTNFSSPSSWNTGTNTTISNNKAILTVTGGGLQYATNIGLDVVNTKTYKFVFTANRTSGTGNIVFGYDSGNSVSDSPQISTSGTQTIYFKPTYNTPNLGFKSYTGSGDYIWEISDFSVKEVNGNYATMTNMVEGNITNQFPLTKIRNYYRMGDGDFDGFPIIQDQTSRNLATIPTTNLLLYSEDFSDVYWNKQSNITPTYNTTETTSPIGTNNVTKLVGNGTDGILRAGINVTGVVARSVYLKSVTGNINVKLKDPNLTITTLTLDVTTEWQRFELSEDNGTSLQGIWVDDIPASGIYIWGFQFEAQSQATAYIKSDGIAAVRKATTTNLLPYSEEISQYSKAGGTTVINDNTTSPDGTVNASKVTKGGTTPNERVYVDNFGISNTTNYSLSAFIKNDDIVNGGVSTIAARNNGGTLIRQGYVWNGSTLSITSSQQGGTRTNVLLEDYGNGWWKIGFSFTSDSTTADIEIDIDRVNGTDTTAIFLWGVQLEEQTQAETYAPTKGLPVTIDLFTENNYGTMTNMSANDIVIDTPVS